MPSTGLSGPFDLTAATIDQAVNQKRPGAYALGRLDAAGTFLISRIGRSDYNLNQRLHDYVGQYTSFKASYCDSAEAAYHKECDLFHNFGPPDNDIHPDKPRGVNPSCRHCGQ